LKAHCRRTRRAAAIKFTSLYGDDGDDGTTSIIYVYFKEYICSSEAEIIDALDAIGTDTGVITIISNITLSQTIQIDGGGSYIIKGQGAGKVIDCGGHRGAFNITNSQSCTIQDLTIFCKDLVSVPIQPTIINIDELNDNAVYIERVNIIGDKIDRGYAAIYIQSDNVWISDCYIARIAYGIRQSGGTNYAYITKNILVNFNRDGLEFYGNYNYIDANIINETRRDAIYVDGAFNIISRNSVQGSGISSTGDYNSIEENVINGGSGISVSDNNQNSISGNIISNAGYGIIISNSGNNTVSCNTISNIFNDGILLSESDYNAISGNHISDIVRDVNVNISGICITGDSDFNTINGNGCFKCYNNYGSLSHYGFGIYIEKSDCNENTVIGNTALDNEINYYDNGIGTFGDNSNNNFS